MIRSRSRLAALLAPLALAVALVGCSSSGDDAADDKDTSTTESTTTTEAADDTSTTAPDNSASEPDMGEDAVGAAEVCTGLKTLSDFDQESAALVAADDWPAIQRFYVDETQSVVDAYNQAIAAGSEVTDDLTTLRDFTAGTAEVAASSTSVVDFGEKLTAQPGLQEAGQAGLALNTFAEANCGFSTGGAGN